MPWLIAYYELEGEKHLGDIPIKQVSVEKLREFFEEPDHEFMYGCLPISKKHADRLRILLDLSENLELNKYAYFLECRSDD